MIPVLLLSMFPSNIFHWMLIAYGMANSTAFIIVNLWEYLLLNKSS